MNTDRILPVNREHLLLICNSYEIIKAKYTKK